MIARALFRDVPTGFATVVLSIVLLLVVLGTAFSPYAPNTIDTSLQLLPPGLDHLFGTDELGRDLFTRFAHGGWTSLGLAIAIVAVSGTVGLLIGTVSGYRGGAVDTVVMRTCDALQAFPLLLLAMLIAYALGRGTLPLFVALTVAYVPYFVKVSRGLALSQRQAVFVEAARTQGAGDIRILATHLVPHVFPPVLTQMTMAAGSALLAIAGLSIIGLGAPAPAPEWGAILAGSATHVFQAWWYVVIPGALITLTAMTFSLLGDSLRDTFDEGAASPRVRRSGAGRVRRAQARRVPA
ncbi:ABC transporter permease [Microbacterium sp.]|uniref:ABC transporter permease n=1 Tax=Microbacterium sp. TaxID=51671 RepID=UPI0039E7066D